VKLRPLYALLVLAAAAPVVSSQSQPEPGTAFPAALLEGSSKFNFAVFYQADLRGNFGPCG